MTDRSAPRPRILAARLGALAAAAALGACGGGGGGGGDGGTTSADSTGCSVLEQNEFVLAAMDDVYLWYDQMPTVDPADFGSPEALLECLVGRAAGCDGSREAGTPDDRFSGISSAATEQALFGAGQFLGLGFRSQIEVPDTITISEVFEGSPADGAGLARGQRVLEINGIPADQVIENGGVGTATGPDEVGTLVTFLLEEQDGSQFNTSAEKAVVTIPTVSAVSVFDVAGRPTGYFNFRTFVDTAEAELNAAAAQLTAAGIQDLVVDLRYNTGGLVSIAEFLANLLEGARADGQVFASVEYNDKLSNFNQVTLFRDPGNSLDTPRVVFITTEASASASELVINGLEPFVEVRLVGADTFGKPVGQVGIPFCEKVLRPASFTTANANGDSDFYDGLPVDCAAEDDTTAQLGDPTEASLAEALYLLENNVCSVASVARSLDPLAQKPGGPVAADIERQMINAW